MKNRVPARAHGRKVVGTKQNRKENQENPERWSRWGGMDERMQ
jgi:hypothetical protein